MSCRRKLERLVAPASSLKDQVSRTRIQIRVSQSPLSGDEDCTHAPPGPNSARQGAFHESEIFYIFNSLEVNDRPWTDEDRRIADLMSSYWANFAANGDPNGKGLPPWPAANALSPLVMELGNRFEPITIGEPTRLAFIRRFYETHAASAGRWQ